MVEILNKCSSLGKTETWGTRNKISLDVQDLQDAATLLLCRVQDPQDLINCQSRIQDLQDPATSFLSEIQDPQDPTIILLSQDPISLRSHKEMKIQDPTSSKISDLGSWRSGITDLFGIFAKVWCGGCKAPLAVAREARHDTAERWTKRQQIGSEAYGL